MEYGHAATFLGDGRGEFEIWGVFDEDDAPSQEIPFRWTVKNGFEVELVPCNSADDHHCDWGTFTADFYLSYDCYGNSFVTLRDGSSNDHEPFWWFRDPIKHPMRLLKK